MFRKLIFIMLLFFGSPLLFAAPYCGDLFSAQDSRSQQAIDYDRLNLLENDELSLEEALEVFVDTLSAAGTIIQKVNTEVFDDTELNSYLSRKVGYEVLSKNNELTASVREHADFIRSTLRIIDIVDRLLEESGILEIPDNGFQDIKQSFTEKKAHLKSELERIESDLSQLENQ